MRYSVNLVAALCLIAQCSIAQENKLSYGDRMAHAVLTSWKNALFHDTTREAIWSYDQGVVYNGLTSLWKYTGNADYFRYVKKHVDDFVKDDGTIRTYNKEDYNLDNIKNGDAVLMLYKVTGESKYWQAASLLYSQLQTHPRTNEGGFWHKKVYPYQMWLDGLYMAEPFYAAYAELIHSDSAFNDIANQFVFIEKHTRDNATGLLYHGWDESKQQKWADKTTGNSPNFWARAMGWYGMALVDAMEHFRDDNPRKKELINIVQRYAEAVIKVQDKRSGLWWDVLNFPGREGNYFESSASCMFVYALAKAVRLGYLPGSYIAPASKGFEGICDTFVSKDANCLMSLKGTVSVSGLGGNPYRDGTYEYYIKEKVITNDLKGIGAFLNMCSEMEILPARQLGKDKKILLDGYFNHEIRKDIVTGDSVQYHYIWNEEDNNGFSMLKRIFNKYGVETTFAPSGISAATLKPADIYMIVDPDVEKENPHPNYIQPTDVETISNWVKNGGKLLLFGNDSGNAEFGHFNKLAAKFGIQFNENSHNRVKGLNFIDGTLMIDNGNVIFKTVRKVYLKEIATLALKTPALPVLAEGKDVIMAIAKYGKGTVFAVGDPWLYNEYVDGRKLPADLENYKAAEELVQWLLKQ